MKDRRHGATRKAREGRPPTRWQLSDGTIVESGGRVLGAGENARKLRALLDTPPVYVTVGPLPDGRMPLDPDNDFLLDAFVRQKALWLELEVETAYVADFDDAPVEVQTLVRDLEAEPFDPDAIY